MADPDKIQIDLIKLSEGGRLLRLTDPKSGLALERKLDAALPVNQQKQQLLRVFDAVLSRAELAIG